MLYSLRQRTWQWIYYIYRQIDTYKYGNLFGKLIWINGGLLIVMFDSWRVAMMQVILNLLTWLTNVKYVFGWFVFWLKNWKIIVVTVICWFPIPISFQLLYAYLPSKQHHPKKNRKQSLTGACFLFLFWLLDYIIIDCHYSPPARWGLLDFIRVVLLLLLLG